MGVCGVQKITNTRQYDIQRLHHSVVTVGIYCINPEILLFGAKEETSIPCARKFSILILIDRQGKNHSDISYMSDTVSVLYIKRLNFSTHPFSNPVDPRLIRNLQLPLLAWQLHERPSLVFVQLVLSTYHSIWTLLHSVLPQSFAFYTLTASRKSLHLLCLNVCCLPNICYVEGQEAT